MGPILRIVGDSDGMAFAPDGRAPILRVLDLARWAPSGDNTQVWRFRVLNGQTAVVEGSDTREHVLYDRDGEASHLALGALIETARIAATGLGCSLDWCPIDSDPRRPRFRLELRPSARRADRLAAWITTRSTQRRPLSLHAPTAIDRSLVEGAVVETGFRLRWFTSMRERLDWARVWWQTAGIRLRCPEAYAVHRDILDWDRARSPDRVPVASLGASPPLRLAMRWGLRSWTRLDRMNRWFAGTIAPRVELDLLPALACGAHVALVADPRAPAGLAGRLAAGAAVQRLWLGATSAGLRLQPAYTPLVFAAYDRAGEAFTADPAVQAEARRLRQRLEALLGADAGRTVFLARLGYGSEPAARSVRLPLDDLVLPTEAIPAEAGH